MLKRVLTVVLLIITASCLSVFSEEGPINVIIDGEAMVFTEDYGFPVEQNDRILLPFRQVFEKYGWMPVYDEGTQTILAVKENSYMAMQIGSKAYHFGDKTIEFDTAPIIINGRTLVPVRVVSEGLGFTVDYDEATRSVIVSTK